MTLMTPLRAARKRLGRTLTEVAQATGIDQGNLSRIETAKQGASLETAEILAKYFAGEVTEMQILYPERFLCDEHDDDPESEHANHHNADGQG